MEILTLLLLAVGLSFDSFAISVSCGLASRNIQLNHAFKLAFVFALVQALCFFIGCVFGQSLRGMIGDFDHWIAFVLLGILGAKMIYENLTKSDDECACKNVTPLKFSAVLVMAVATSIDAVVVGLGIALVDVPIYRLGLGLLIIALVTGFAAMTGLFVGKKTGKHIGERAEILGGLVLIGIGVKILAEHLHFI